MSIKNFMHMYVFMYVCVCIYTHTICVKLDIIQCICCRPERNYVFTVPLLQLKHTHMYRYIYIYTDTMQVRYVETCDPEPSR